jgi:membrane protease YdiL (CAAX protease family)
MVNQNERLNDKTRALLSLILGTLVVLWRVVLPTNVEITFGIVALVMALDLLLTAALVFINRYELKEAFSKRFTIKTLGVIILWLVLFVAFSILGEIAISALLTPFMPPAAWVSGQFSGIFPLSMIICGVIAAPIWEEIAFRMAGRSLIKNKILFVLITTILFVFIHTGFAMGTGAPYAISGVAFAIMYLVTKDIRIVMAVHFLGNAIGILPGFFFSLFQG